MVYLDPQKTVDLLANALKNIEEAVYQSDKAVILPNLARCIQLDGWTCGARALYSILRYYARRCTVGSVEKELRTDWEGTDVADLKRVLTKHGLKFQETKRCSISDLTNALDDGFPILISSQNSTHYSVVYGYSNEAIFVMNPAIIGECGSLACRVPKKRFKEIWDHWGIIVSDQ